MSEFLGFLNSPGKMLLNPLMYIQDKEKQLAYVAQNFILLNLLKMYYLHTYTFLLLKKGSYTKKCYVTQHTLALALRKN